MAKIARAAEGVGRKETPQAASHRNIGSPALRESFWMECWLEGAPELWANELFPAMFRKRGLYTVFVSKEDCIREHELCPQVLFLAKTLGTLTF